MLGDLRPLGARVLPGRWGGLIMLRGRYGYGWMIVAWLAIIVLLGGGIWLVGQLPRLFGSN